MLPEEIEVHRDRMWRRDPEYRIEDVYAAERFITVVPEIDMPGHTNAALASYDDGSGHALYVAGRFTNAGATSAKNIAP